MLIMDSPVFITSSYMAGDMTTGCHQASCWQAPSCWDYGEIGHIRSRNALLFIDGRTVVYQFHSIYL